MKHGQAVDALFEQGVGQDVSVPGGQSDAAERRQRGSYVCRGCFVEILAMLDSESHEQDGYVLIVVIGSAVTCPVGSRFSWGRAIHQPVWLRNDEQVAAAPREVTVGERATGGALRRRAILQLLCAKDMGHSGLRKRGTGDGLQCLRVLSQSFVNARSEIYIAAGDAQDCGFREMERIQDLFQLVLQLRNVQDAGVNASLLHVLRNGGDAMVGAEGHNVIPAAYFVVQIVEQVTQILVQTHEEILDLPAARAEFVTDIIEGGITHA